MTDIELLQSYVETGAQDAFATLVERHVNLVYSAAARQVGGDTHLAWDVTQGVFLALAQNAPRLVHHAALAGWVYTATRFTSAKLVRQRRRWQARESVAHEMGEPLNVIARDDVTERDWQEIRPALDEAMHELMEHDKIVILLRYFEDRPLAEIGAIYGVNENTARMRVERALEKLRLRLAKRGITSTATALGTTLATRSVTAAPADLLTATTRLGSFAAPAAVASGTIATVGATLELMSAGKITVMALALAAAFGIGAAVGTKRSSRHPSFGVAREMQSTSMAALESENERLHKELESLRTQRPSAVTSDEPQTATRRPKPSGSSPQWEMLAELQSKGIVNSHLTFVTPNGKLGDGFATLFELTAAERSTLEKVVASASEQLAALERENATVTRDNNGNVVIAVRPFVAAGGVIYDALMQTFADTLGPERNAAFLKLGAQQVESAMANFGAQVRTVTFAYDPSKGSEVGGPFFVRDEFRDGPKNWGSSATNVRTLADVANRCGTIAKLLPPDFGPSK